MKISKSTLDILKNFANINPSIKIKPGTELRTITPQRNLMAEVQIEDEFSNQINIYDLNEFLRVFALFPDDPEIQFGDKFMNIVGKNGRSSCRYVYADPEAISGVPDKRLSLPNVDVSFKLTAEDLKYTLSFANSLACPEIAFESDGQEMRVSTVDVKNDTHSTQSLNLADGNGQKYYLVFKTEILSKLMLRNYDVEISGSTFFAKFSSDDKKLTYWLAVEKDQSKFGE